MPSGGLPERLHYLLTRQVVETGHAPDPGRLGSLAGCLRKRLRAVCNNSARCAA
ncbi:MAG: hypothetical protein ACRD8O_03775 [Bryobacteraceae bacterium]